MAFTLYDATVANYLQILGSVGGYLDKSSESESAAVGHHRGVERRGGLHAQDGGDCARA